MLVGIAWTFTTLLLLIIVWGVTGLALIQPVLRQSHHPINHYLSASFALMAGSLASILILLTLGMLALLTPGFIIGTHTIALACASAVVFRDLRAAISRITLPISIELLMVSISLLVVASLSWQPPGMWDDTSFHLPLARFYLEEEAIVLQEYLRFPLFPQNINILMLLGLAVGDTVTAQAFASVPWFVAMIGMMGASLWLMGNALPGILLSVPLLLFGPLAETIGFAYVDMGLAMFCWGGCLALAIAVHQASNQRSGIYWAFLAGALLGAATGSKLFGAVYTAILGAALLVFTRDFKFIASLVAGGLLTGSWWYIRSYLISGDPIHPAGGAYFGYFLWNADDLISQTAEQHTHGVAPTLANLWTALVIARIEIWVLIIPGLLMTGVPKAIRLIQITVIGYFIFWFFVTQVARYLAPIAVPALFLSGYSLYRILLFVGKPLLKQPLAAWSRLIAQLLIFGLLITQTKNIIERRNFIWEERLATKNGYVQLQEANKLIPQYGNRLLQVGYENAAYFYEGILIGDWFGPGRYSNMISCDATKCQLTSQDELQKVLIRFESQWILISKRFVPAFQAVDYESKFKVLYEDDTSALLALRKNSNQVHNVETMNN